MKKITVIFSILLIGISINTCMAGDTPSEVVRKFCQFDFEGARLSSKTYSDIVPLISYPEEPGWDTVISITGYTIKKEKIFGNNAEVIVEYNIDQSWPAGVTIPNIEVIKLAQYDGAWRIKEYVMYPRVSKDVLCKKFKRCKEKS